MANPAPPQPEAPRPWYAGLIGFVFAALVLGAVAVSTAWSYDSSDDHADGSEHSDDADHSDDGDHSGESDDAEHSE